MTEVTFEEGFKHLFSKIKNPILRERIIKLIAKIKENPEIGKPMRYGRKGSRELYIPPFRLSYIFFKDRDLVYILDLYHKDEQ